MHDAKSAVQRYLAKEPEAMSQGLVRCDGLRVSHARTEIASAVCDEKRGGDGCLRSKQWSPEIRRAARCRSSTPDLNSRAECGRAGVAGESWAKAIIRLHHRSCVRIGLRGDNPEAKFRRSHDRNCIGRDKAALCVITFTGMLVM